MLTKNEITALSLSPTKKDFVQIWNELLEVAGKLSERWDPTSTNESDPGIVILKALTGIADKLNYNIDKNTLEAFMPTAAQEDSMRKLCDMLGYNVKYFRSAETSVTIKYYNNDPSEDETSAIKSGLLIPKFTVITNSDKDISYFTTNQVPYYISDTTPSVTLPCMEGQIVKCEGTTDNNVITISQISNNRFYLPEAQIAENGIFIYNVSSANLGTELMPSWELADGTPWEKVDNLNIQARGERVFKFGYDSYESRPYVEFPSDCSELINDGLFIYYARTSGANGNVSPRTLTQFEKPSGNDWGAVPVESFSVENTFAATTGANIETIKQAYNNFKKTIGTFETLVTCRDYMNKIYSMTDDSNRPLVSNILVTDIRNDLNRAVTICSCDGAGIFYKETPLTNVTVVDTPGEPEYIDGQKITTITRVVEKEPAINYFDLVLYPFKSYSQIKNNVRDIQETYDSSFKYDLQSFNTLKRDLDEKQAKTIAHNIISPEQDDIVCINNYLRLSAIIGTNTKITTEEGSLLKEVIKVALANAFNMRELDFGEEIPFESIVEVIENADSRIKVVSLNEPALYTTFSVIDSYDAYSNPVLKEYAVASEWFTEEDADLSGRFEIQKDAEGNYTGGSFNAKNAKEIYNKLAVRNLLAGRLPLFKYHTTFGTSFSEGAYRATTELGNGEAGYSRLPVDLQKKTEWKYENNAPAICLLDGTTYTKQVDSVNGVVVYSKSATPKENEAEAVPKDKYPGNIIVKDSDDDNNITEIETSCEIPATADDQGVKKVSSVTLSTGEFIKFRAPNFVTTKTYPAYVNYHLALNKELIAGATGAQAETLFSLLNTGAAATRAKNWEKVFNYFGSIKKKKTFTLAQKISKNSENNPETTTPGLTVDNPIVEDTKETPRTIIAKSCCIKLRNEGRPIITGAPNVNAEAFKITLSDDTLFISDIAVFDTTSEESLQYKVNALINSLPSDNLPDGEWSIAYEFEYVPFEASTLADWEKFVRQEGRDLFGFTPAENAGTVLWRVYGDSYSVGKFILDEGAKLLPFTSTYFGTLDNLYSRLHGIYIAKDLGRDAAANVITNTTEYELKQNEYLYIEYTPSTTTEDGTSQTQEPIKEIYGPGTIIRPNGFEEGLMDSSVYATKGHSALKNATFDSLTKEIPLFSFGPNEQVEIRERSQTVLNKDLFANSSAIYVYKNFNNCPELEEIPSDGSGYQNGKRINSSYTLKDGEYIFYTDQNKTELAYFTSGTEVILTGNVVLPKFEIIDLAVIFDSGIQQIPWSPLSFARNTTMQEADSITFQEYQYITLGPDDTLDELTLVNTNSDCINNTWQYCSDVKYTAAGSTDPVPLNPINIAATGDTGCGWEVSSILELAVSPNTAQVLRTTDKVKTSLTLHKTAASGVVNNEHDIIVEAENSASPLSFKTNIACQSSNGKVKLSELYTNTNNAKSFELKVFSDEVPAIITTIHDTLIPYTGKTAEERSVASTLTLASYSELWNHATLETLKTTSSEYDKAIKLSVSILPNTYGVFSIYLDYGKTAEGSKTWLELLPGAEKSSITLFNADATWEDKDEKDENEKPINPRLILNPGLNCVRVNATCDIYIKTAGTSNGTLYFDDLRLVDVKKLESVGDGGIKTYQTTQGLNLEQLGYLDTSDESTNTFNIFDMRVRKKLKEDYTATALAKLDDMAKASAENFATSYKELVDSKAKVQELIKFIDKAKAEITALQSVDNETLKNLFNSYSDVCTDLKQEIALKEALTNNVEINDLEKSLATLYGESLSVEAAKQELLTKLGELREKVLVSADKFNSLPKETIFADFEASATSTDSQLIADLKLASLEKINTTYDEQLAIIAKNISSIADSDAAATLTAALEKLYAKKHTELLNSAQSLVTENQDALLNAVADAYATAEGSLVEGKYEVNYSEVANKLVLLRDQVNNFNINALVADIEFAVGTSAYAELGDLVEALQSELSAVNTELLTSINEVLADVQAKTGTEKDTEVLAAIADIQSSIKANYINQINTVLDKITAILDDIDAYTDVIENLKSSKDSQVSGFAGQLEAITAAIVTDTEKVTRFGTTEDFNIITAYADANMLPFGKEAALSIWPGYMKTAFIAGIDSLYETIYNVINSESATISNPFDDRAVLKKVANFKAFKELFKQAELLANEDTRNEKRRELINGISALIVSNELTVKMNAIKNDDSSRLDRNVVICSIINKLQADTAPDAAEKYQLIQELIEELDKEIKLDTNLVDISAKLLCPSILLYEEKSDDFYDNLNTFVSTTKARLLAVTDDYSDEIGYENAEGTKHKGAIMTSLEAQQKVSTIFELLNEATIEEFTKTLKGLEDDLVAIEDDDDYTLLLTKEYINKFIDLLGIIDYQDQITKVKNLKLFKILTKSDLVTAWADPNGAWLDSTGAKFKYTSDTSGDAWQTGAGKTVSVDVKRDTDGKWKDMSGNEIQIKGTRPEEGAQEAWFADDKANDIQVSTLNTELNTLLEALVAEVGPLGQTIIPEAFKDAWKTLKLEEQLLGEIRAIDKDRLFYYNVPIEPNVAIDFTESDAKLNTLMNPAVNYDINNVNNSFVISKLDINYLTNGLQIARSSRIS